MFSGSELPPPDLKQLAQDLLTPGSIAYIEYQTGVATVEFDRDVALEALGLSDDASSRETYEDIMKSRQLDKLLNEKFGI